MAITFVSSFAGTAANGGSPTTTIPSAQSSDYIVVAATLGTSRTPAVTIYTSSGGAWPALFATLAVGTANARFRVFGMLASSTPPTTVTASGTGNSSDSCAFYGIVYRGVISSAPIDVTTTTTTGNSTTPDSPSITVATSNDTIITLVGIAANTAATPPSSFLGSSGGLARAADNNPATSGQAYFLTYPSTSPIDPDHWSMSTAFQWAAATVALKSVAGGGVSTSPEILYLPLGEPIQRTEIVGY